MGKYDGKLAVVTGGSTGIGFATARLLVAEGATVVLTARSKEALAAAAKELGPKAITVVSDAAKLPDIDALATQVAALGKVDFLFFNAGIAKFAPLEATTEAAYDEIQDINT